MIRKRKEGSTEGDHAEEKKVRWMGKGTNVDRQERKDLGEVQTRTLNGWDGLKWDG